MLNLKPKIEKTKRDVARNVRAILLVEKISPCLLTYEIADAIIKSLHPFVELTFSALIINELVKGRNLTVLAELVLLFMFGTFLFGIADDILSKNISVKRELFNESHEIFLNSYSFSMDFEKVENPATTELREQIEGIMDTENGGLKAVPVHIGELCKNVVSATVAGAMCFRMLYAVNSEGIKVLGITSNWFAAVFAGVIILCVLYISISEKRQKEKMFQATMDGTRHNRYLSYYLYEYLDDNMYAKDIRIFHQSELITREMQEKGFDAWVKVFKACESLEKRYGGQNSFISSLMSGIVYIFVALRAFAGAIGIGDVMKYCGAINQLITSLSGVAAIWASMENNSSYLSLVFSYMDLGKDVHIGTKAVIPSPEGSYEFEFHNVSFKYAGTDVYALKNLSFRIRNRERLAVVGMNGSGKTTMIKLLSGLYKPDQGYITLNGINIEEYNYQQYRRLFAVVFQDFRLFAFPLGENVATCKVYDCQKVWNVLERAGIRSRVEGLEHQLKHPLYKQFDDAGVDISGGEEQKIAISRALYRNAGIYILDEPTAALDPESEYEIYAKMNELTGHNTVIFISHRLSSCCGSDNIIVFHNGEIVQNGTHEKLLKDVSGKYYELWNAQARHYERISQN